MVLDPVAGQKVYQRRQTTKPHGHHSKTIRSSARAAGRPQGRSASRRLTTTRRLPHVSSAMHPHLHAQYAALLHSVIVTRKKGRLIAEYEELWGDCKTTKSCA